jgi:RNA polymerase sigma factor (sigma-70 family)
MPDRASETGTVPFAAGPLPGAVITNPGAPPSGSVADNRGLQPAVPPSPVAVVRLAGFPASVSSDSFPASQINTFQISRLPVSDTTLQVPYTVNEYTSAGFASYDSVAIITGGANYVTVPVGPTPAGKVNDCEIVALTLRDGNQYRISQPCATIYLAGNARACSDTALLAAYQQTKSGEAFGVLLERHQCAVMRTCYRILGNWLDAEDVSQGVFLTLAQQPVRILSSLPAWLTMVARNAAIAYLRSRNRRNRHEQRAAKRIRVASEESTYDLREHLDVALMQIPAPLHEAVRLRYLDGLSQLEAAQVVGCPRGTLSQRTAHGVRRLREVLGSAD